MSNIIIVQLMNINKTAPFMCLKWIWANMAYDNWYGGGCCLHINEFIQFMIHHN